MHFPGASTCTYRASRTKYYANQKYYINVRLYLIQRTVEASQAFLKRSQFLRGKFLKCVLFIVNLKNTKLVVALLQSTFLKTNYFNLHEEN